MRGLRAILTLFVLYAVAAAPAFLVGEGRVIILPGTADAAEVFFELPGSWDSPYDARIEPFNHAMDHATARAESHPHDLAPPYILRDPFRLVLPYVTPRGRVLAVAPITGMAWPGQAWTTFRVTPVTQQVQHSQADLRTLMDAEPGPLAEESVYAMGVRAQDNRVVVETNTLDPGMWSRFAAAYGDMLAIRWDPFGEPMMLL